MNPPQTIGTKETILIPRLDKHCISFMEEIGQGYFDQVYREETLKTYEEDNRVKEDYQRRINELDRLLEDLECDMRHVYENQQKWKDTDTSNRKLEHFKLIEESLRDISKKLHNDIDQITKRLEDLKLDNGKCSRKIEELDRCSENLENQLSEIEAADKKLCREIGQLSQTVECTENELRGVRQQTEQCRLTTEPLRGCCAVLEANLERELTAQADLNARLSETSARLERGRAALVERQEPTAQALRDARAECASVMSRVADERRDAVELAARTTELRDQRAALRRDADAREKLIRDDIAAKARQLDEARSGDSAKASEAMASETAAVARHARDMTDRLAGEERRATEECRKRSDARSRMERELEAAERDARSRAAALQELEREVSCLRDEAERWRESHSAGGRPENDRDHYESAGDDKGSDMGSCRTAAGLMDRLHVDLEQTKRDAEASAGLADSVTSDGSGFQPSDGMPKSIKLMHDKVLQDVMGLSVKLKSLLGF